MSIVEALEWLQQTDYYPFHMPGHKRRMANHPLSQAYERDITEIDGFDNLHDPQGIILESMEKAKKLYGTKETFFLVNGSTAGILTAVHACVSYGEKIIVSRNSHKSVYHAIALLNLQAVYLMPKQIPEWGMAAGISSKEVEKAVRENPDAKAVLITSPTYEGFVSPIREIARLVHGAKIPLIVDEAHGAHFPFSDRFPDSALEQGADLVVQSLHKTMPSLTQTALLHLQGDLVELRRVKRFLAVFQSSSPSYLFLGSIENCLCLVEKRGKALWEPILAEMEKFCQETQRLNHIRVRPGEEERDSLKLIIAPWKAKSGGRPYTGADLYRELLETYHIQMEMAAFGYTLGIVTCMDEAEGLNRLKTALMEIDRRLTAAEAEGAFAAEEVPRPDLPEVKESIGEALNQEAEQIALTQAGGREAAGFVNLYPPGIPLIVPGEVISPQFVATLLTYSKQNLPIQGLEEGKVAVVRDSR